MKQQKIKVSRRPSDCVVSVIIPLYVYNDRFFSDLRKFDKQTFRQFEILVVSDTDVVLPSLLHVPVRLILTQSHTTGPARKRDIALRYAHGSICAFIDDDAYPDSNWIKHAIFDFKDPSIVAVGGPAITPPEDGFWEKLSGLVYASLLCSGAARYRFVPEDPRDTEDFPAYNLMVRKETLKKIGGYGNDFYGGEDTFLCMKLKKEGRIYYDPSVVVCHHRRPLFLPLIRQIANVGKHRGYFAIHFPETSRKWFYFMPSLFFIVIALFSSVAIHGTVLFQTITLSLVFGFIFMGSLSVINQTSILNSILVGVGIFIVHLTYGLYFLIGMGTKRMTT